VCLALNESEEKLERLNKYPTRGDSNNNYNLNRSLVICNSCYWSASNITENSIVFCPVCGKYNLESIPLSINERYTYYYDIKKGLVLHFTKLTVIDKGIK
jgi:hypothetical protein